MHLLLLVCPSFVSSYADSVRRRETHPVSWGYRAPHVPHVPRVPHVSEKSPMWLQSLKHPSATWPHQHPYTAIAEDILKAKAIEQHNASSSSYKYVSDERRACLDTPLGFGVVKMVSEEDDGTYWRFTVAWLQGLVVVAHVVDPEKVLQLAYDTPLDQSVTKYHLLDGMLFSGWSWHLDNPRKSQPCRERQPTLIVGKPDATTPQFRHCLFALHDATGICADGFIDGIKHG